MSKRALGNPERTGESGAALLIALLIVATLSIIAVTLQRAGLQAVKSATLGEARAQTGWHVLGAEALAASLLTQSAGAVEGKFTRSTPGLGQPIVFPIEAGRIAVTVADASNCFNINSLAVSAQEAVEQNQPDPAQFYERLLIAVGVDRNDVSTLVDTAADWVDEDTGPRPFGAETAFYASGATPYAAADAPMVALSELRAVRGYDAALVQRIAPFLCAHPDTRIGPFNINTMEPWQSPLLVPVFADLVSLETLTGLLFEEGEPGRTVAEFLEAPSLAAIAPENRYDDVLSDTSTWFDMRGEVVYLDVQTPFYALFEIDAASSAQLVRRRLGADE